MLRNGLPEHLTHAYLVMLRNFSRLNEEVGWAAGNEALASFSHTLIEMFPAALVFRVMGDDFALLSPHPLAIDGAALKANTSLVETVVEVEVQHLDPRGPDRDTLLKLL
jgi:GGDEF domain-containing protein